MDIKSFIQHCEDILPLVVTDGRNLTGKGSKFCLCPPAGACPCNKLIHITTLILISQRATATNTYDI